MKNLVKVILIIALLTIAFKVKKNVRFSDFDLYITTSDLNVRTGAGTKFPILFTLKEGDEVDVLSKNGNWFEIKVQNKRGFAYSRYLEPCITVSNNASNLSPRPISFVVLGIPAIFVIVIGLNINKRIRKKRQLKSVTKLDRGTRSERELVLKLLKFGMPAQDIFHDLYVEKGNNHFSQIDLVVVTEVGIIVIEVKDYSGWIYGTGNQRQWTKVLAYGKQKYRFYNPLMQNHRHITALRKKLNFSNSVPFYSVVLFFGDCELKDISFVPKDSFISKSDRVFEVLDAISKNNPPVQYSDRDELVRVLEQAEKNGDYVENQIQHKETLMICWAQTGSLVKLIG